VLSKTILFGALALVTALVAAKLFFPSKWRELGRRVDRTVNAVLIALALVYTGQVLWWLFNAR
jgi:hypothetical protein